MNVYDPRTHGVCPWPRPVIDPREGEREVYHTGRGVCACGLEVRLDPDGAGWSHYVEGDVATAASWPPPTSSEVVDAIETVRESYAGFLEDWRALGEVLEAVDPASYRRVDAYISWDGPRDIGAGHDLPTWLRELEQSAVDAEDVG